MFRRVVSALGGLRGSRADVEPEPDRLPEGTRIYAVGDIHGRADLLARMRDMIAADIGIARPADALIVLLGDYVDRGPNSDLVLETLSCGDFPAPILPLIGNHEAMLLDFIHRPETGETWRRFGGVETTHSYGVDVAELRAGQNLAAVSERLRAAMPDHHLEFLRSGLHPFYSAGAYFFCHAGVRPGIPLGDQQEEDLLWIRDEFISSDADFGAVVVHGHTPSEQPMVRDNAIGIDTGAYITGRLTCLVLGQREVSFLST